MKNVLHFIFGTNMKIKYSYSLPLTEGTSNIDYDEFVDYIGGDDFNAENIREAIRTIAIEDLESKCGNDCPEFDITVSDEYVNELLTYLKTKRAAQDDAVEAIKKILDDFDYETQNRILSMI